jgi:hypothetical protein
MIAFYFTPSVGACGFTNDDSQLVASVSPEVFNSYPYAFRYFVFLLGYSPTILILLEELRLTPTSEISIPDY